MTFLTSWQFWLGLMLVALALEFSISGVGILAVVAIAAGLVAGGIFIAGLLFQPIVSWEPVVLAFAACLVVVLLGARLFWRRKPQSPDINTY